MSVPDVSRWEFNGSVSPDFFEPEVIGRDMILDLCSRMDFNVVLGGSLGLLVSLFLFFWFGRLRPVCVRSMSPLLLRVLDKAWLVVVALCFAMVLSNSLRFG